MVERIRTNIGHIRVKMLGTYFPDRVEVTEKLNIFTIIGNHELLDISSYHFFLYISKLNIKIILRIITVKEKWGQRPFSQICYTIS